MRLLDNNPERLKGRERADDLGSSQAGRGQNEARAAVRGRPQATQRPQRIPETKGFPETEETELE